MNIVVDERHEGATNDRGATLTYMQALTIAVHKSEKLIGDNKSLTFRKCKRIDQIGAFQRWVFQFMAGK